MNDQSDQIAQVLTEIADKIDVAVASADRRGDDIGEIVQEIRDIRQAVDRIEIALTERTGV